jgi:hypothetical protein
MHSDQKKITYAKSTSDRVMRWNLRIEECGPKFRHIKGKHHLIDDALSRLEVDDSSEVSNLERPTAPFIAAIISRNEKNHDKLSEIDGFEMAEYFGIKKKENQR